MKKDWNSFGMAEKIMFCFVLFVILQLAVVVSFGSYLIWKVIL